jgi:phosphatidylinositol alpha-mannosyltransferase
MRICLVTPFAWSQPHDVNEHVAGVAAALRASGHSVTVLAPSTRAADLLAGRRALLHGEPAEVIALGPAVPVSRRSQLGVPVGVQANLRQALAQGSYDVVHGFEPGLPSLSYLALRDTDALAVATFASADRLGYPPARSLREKLLARLDALIALSDDVRVAAEERFPGDYRVTRRCSRPAASRRRSSSSSARTNEWSPAASSACFVSFPAGTSCSSARAR